MSVPMRTQVESDYGEQDSWRFAESPVESKNLSLEAEQEDDHTSPGPFVVRTLKDPPEIWDLVREAPRDFNPGGAFLARLTSSKTKVLLLTLSVMFVSGLGFFGVKTLRDSRNHEGVATQVQDDTSETVSVPQAMDTASSPVNADLNTQLTTQSNTKSGAGDAVTSQSTLPQPANSNPEAASADPSLRNSIQPTGESVSQLSKLAESASGGAEASSVSKRSAFASGWRNADNTRSPRQENEIAGAPDTTAAPQTSHAPLTTNESGIKANAERSSRDPASAKKSSDQTSTPPPTGPPTTSSAGGANAPKAKVIQWP